MDEDTGARDGNTGEFGCARVGAQGQHLAPEPGVSKQQVEKKSDQKREEHKKLGCRPA